MSDPRTTTASKNPVKDLPQGKPEKKDLNVREGRDEGEFAADVQSAGDTSDLSAAGAAPGTGRARSEPVDRARGAEDRQSAGEVPLLQSAMLAATRNVETMISSTNAAMRAAEDVTHTAVEYGQRNFQQISAMLRSFSEARSVADLVAIHRDHTRVILEDFVEEATRLGTDLSKRFGEMVDAVVKQEPDPADVTRRKAA